MSVGQMSVGQMPDDQMSVGQMPDDQMSVDQMSVEFQLAKRLSANACKLK
jgi:hypothetical protein